MRLSASLVHLFCFLFPGRDLGTHLLSSVFLRSPIPKRRARCHANPPSYVCRGPRGIKSVNASHPWPASWRAFCPLYSENFT
ncbi:hypothetical protein B0T11DRAFT_276694 [Plectosphaerella cucumerina]|uniref:Secreted protein n=1 Tax=Plectosphaerella cucumerina TaxID=40658 RepID=A0A8K0TIP6_9PEZI|nr:hypothetical protein B0T11DRAFT_276694 [Plectosphaerella cucumerina]